MKKLIKLNKIQALKQIAAGKVIYACPSKLNPHFADGAFLSRLDLAGLGETTFENWRNSYLYYSGDQCRGKTIHFYLEL